MKILQPLDKLFNNVFSTGIFAYKFGMLSPVILCGCGAIRLGNKNVLLALIHFVIALNLTCVYITEFYLAYKVTEKSQELKEVIESRLLEKQGTMTRDVKKYGRLRLDSIPELAINVGSFHRAERESVPIIDFSVRQICNLLLALLVRH